MSDGSHPQATQMARETLLKRRPWYGLAVTLLLLSAVSRQPLVFLAALFALVCGLVPELWYRRSLWRLRLDLELDRSAVPLGQEVTLTLRAENRKLLPLPWLEVEIEIPRQLPLLSGRSLPSYKANRALLVNGLAIWGYQRVRRRYRLRCPQRGVYSLGPLLVRTGDPFGWLIRQELLERQVRLLVYPQVLPLADFGLTTLAPLGTQTSLLRLLEDPLRFAGVRPYQPGDDPRYLHWKASARGAGLYRKLFEPASTARLLLALNINTFREPWMGIDAGLQELLISLTASLAVWGLQAGYQVGLLVNSLLAPWDERQTGPEEGRQLVRSDQATYHARVAVPCARGDEQELLLLRTLARLLPYMGAAIDPLLEPESLPLPAGGTLLLITAASVLQESTVECLLELRRRGLAPQLVLVGEEDEVAAAAVQKAAGLIPVRHLQGKEQWHELCQMAGVEMETRRQPRPTCSDELA
ncbi:DUF58 domain-containing protein [Thermogemmatispora sp.]|uniref:DUF58 domain-containing protein n=1 Tax=Thermogemmatispora sp. TaxID=1968838 RepID=UPI0035E40F7A